MSDADSSESRSEGEAGTSRYHYSAFISYTDADRAIALRLQSRIESYRFPKQLASKLGFSRLKPVCLDRSEMRAASDLAEAIKHSIRRSQHLIVVSTPKTPGSYWVGKEIDFFREIRSEDHVLAALFEGNEHSSFHPCLLETGTHEHHEPLAADFRKEGDGYRLALLKIIASLADVDLDELVLRDRRRKQVRQLAGGTAAIAATALIAFLSYTAYEASETVDRERILASENMQQQFDELREEIREGGTLNMAAAINRNVEQFYERQDFGSDLPEIEIGRARVLHAKTETGISSTDLDAAQADARAAWNISSNLHANYPDNLDIIFLHAQSAFWVGYTAWLERNTPLAASFFAYYAQLADQLASADPSNSDYVLEQGFAYSNLGMISLREARDLDQAEKNFRTSQEAFREVVGLNPDDLDTVYAIADGESWLADVELFRGNYDAAQSYRDEQVRLLQGLLDAEPENRFFRRGLLSSQIGQARLDAAQGNHQEALRSLRLAYDQADDLLAGDPQNPSLANRKRVIELLQARSELELASTAALAGAGEKIGDCSADWQVAPDGEVPAFCTILRAKFLIRRGQSGSARQVMDDQRLTAWIRSPSLSPTWRFDFREECNRLGMPELCERRG